MHDARHFALILLAVGGAGMIAVLSHRLAALIRIPTPALFLVIAAVAADLIGSLHAPTQRAVERIVTVALILILFDGGIGIGLARIRPVVGPVLLLGTVGTFLTVAAAATLARVALDLSWYQAVLLATAVAPTDPAVVFSVLGGRPIREPGNTVLEGESGANDPVGIALMAGLIEVGHLGSGAFEHVARVFVQQIAIGAFVGVAGGVVLLTLTRRISLPAQGLYLVRNLAAVLVLYGAATVAHGSGFLAVFLAGIVLGDAPVPHKLETERFHSVLAGFGEIVAFSVLGLTVDLSELTHRDVWLSGLLLAVVLAVVIRPVFVGLCLLPVRMSRQAKGFVLFAGLKGAVPILLGGSVVAAGVADSARIYGVVVVVVVFSVVAQGGLVPQVARRLGLVDDPA